MAERRQTALGVARARFLEGLPRKAREVRASVALLAGTPDEERPREELRRRLHALYASAQVFRIEPLADALRDAIAKIDRVRDERRAFDQPELDALSTLAASLPSFAGQDDAPATPSVAPAAKSTPSAERPVRRSPTPSPMPRAERGLRTVASVLVVDDAEQQALVRAALPRDRFEVLGAMDVEGALRLARSSAPDLVLVARNLLESDQLVQRLREDPLTDFVPVVLLVPSGTEIDPVALREAGAEDALAKPLEPAAVLKTVERVAQLAGPTGASTLTGTLTLEELAERLADEVKRGIVEAAEKGHDVAVPMGDGTPLLAATWSAIGRVRAHVAERSGGRIRFREGPARGGPSFVTVVGDEGADDEVPDGTLQGRRILVADDDPAVVWFFAGLLREHGADVVETSDGVEALEEARRRRPDLVVSDILMPRLDGFGLTRALKRDPILADVPVILLSWKEDFIHRMRELKAGASGYLRKEAAAVQILASVRDVLRTRAKLESRLRAGGDVRGRVEDVGIQTLVTTVAALRPDARLTVRDASSLFELDLRAGDLVDATRTAADGTFARGPRVLEAALGTISGRFTVADADGPVRRSLRDPLDVLLDRGMRALAARVDAVSGKNLAKAASVTLDEDLLGSLLRSSPEEVERIATRLGAGIGPRQLLLDAEFEPQVLEEVLVDLARQGAIREVRGPEGEDRIALAARAREEGVQVDALGEGDRFRPTPPPSEAPDAVAALRSVAPPLPGRGSSPPEARVSAIPSLDEPFEDVLPRASDPSVETGTWDPDDDDLDEDLEGSEELDEDDALPTSDDLDDEADDDVDDEDEAAASEPAPSPPSEPPPRGDAPPLRLPPPPKLVSDELPAVSVTPPRPAAPAESKGMGWFGWTMVLLTLAAVGFVVVRFSGIPGASEPRGPLPPVPQPPGDSTPTPTVAADPTPPSDPTAEPIPTIVPTEPAPAPAEDPALPTYGREEPGIAELGVTVPNGQGLLVLDPAPGVSVELGGQRYALGAEPVGVALEPGVHHLTFTRGDHQDFVWVAVRPGHTRHVLPLP